MSTQYIRYPDSAAAAGVPTYANVASFPASPGDGDLAIALDTHKLYEYNSTALAWQVIGGPSPVLSVGTIDSGTPAANGASISSTDLLMQSASATVPGLVNTSAQTFAGAKTFNAAIYADGGLDKSAAGTLSLGTANATTINIGNAGATVNIQGTTLYENVTQLQVTDPLITLNKGGGAGSAANSGFELEENSIITGYVETSADRNSWLLKAPNTAGEATITPGAGGIVINQSSHNPVTLGTANGLSLSTQVLSMNLASATLTGTVSTTTQTFAGAKTFNGDLTTNASVIFAGTVNNSLTGANARIPSHTNVTVTFTNASLTSIASANNGGVASGHLLCLVNATGSTITIVNNYGGAAAGEAILTGASGDILVPNNSAFMLQYNSTASAWLCVISQGRFMGTIDSQTKSANGAVQVGNQLVLQTADGTYPGLVSVSSQTLAGAKTFSTAPILSSLTASLPLKLDASKNITSAAINLSGSEVTSTLPIANGGTGQTTKAAAFDALSPMTTLGDIIYGGASGTGTRLANGTTGQFLKATTSAAPSWASFTAPTVQKFTSGSGTYTTPAGVLYLRVRMVGGGGGGAGSSDDTGNGGSAGNGTSSTFGSSLLTAGGGSGASNPGGENQGGAGGTITVNSPAISLASFNGIQGGGSSLWAATSTYLRPSGGFGAGSPFASGTQSAVTASQTSLANTGVGGAGAGMSGSTSARPGAGGGSGGYIEAIIPNPTTSYAYSVGAAGSAGAAGTNGSAGSAGATGIIIVEEYYQ